jgi:hypothetical protein
MVLVYMAFEAQFRWHDCADHYKKTLSRSHRNSAFCVNENVFKVLNIQTASTGQN